MLRGVWSHHSMFGCFLCVFYQEVRLKFGVVHTTVLCSFIAIKKVCFCKFSFCQCWSCFLTLVSEDRMSIESIGIPETHSESLTHRKVKFTWPFVADAQSHCAHGCEKEHCKAKCEFLSCMKHLIVHTWKLYIPREMLNWFLARTKTQHAWDCCISSSWCGGG